MTEMQRLDDDETEANWIEWAFIDPRFLSGPALRIEQVTNSM